MRSNQEMMKRFSDIVPAVTLIAIVVTGVIAFYAGKATAEHNEKVEAHPVLTQLIRDNSADIDAQKRVWVVIQANNESDHENLAKTQERMILILDRLELKIDRTLATR